MTFSQTASAIADQLGSSWTGPQVLDFISAVNAAPADTTETAWLSLLGENLDQGLRSQLCDLKSQLKANSGKGVKADYAKRLADLRAELRRRGLDGVIVPRTDEHQGEYVSAYAERLAWISGFTGSAGLAIVLADQAAVFVDGRYTIQVRNEVDGDLFTYRHLIDEPATEWIKQHLGVNAKLGIDPWLVTQAQTMVFKKACQDCSASLVELDSNPIDAVWHDQPPRPLAPIVSHPISFAGQSSADKRLMIAEALIADGAHAAVLTTPESLAWAFNLRGGDVPFAPMFLGFAILHVDQSADLLVDERKVLPEVKEVLGDKVRIHAPDDFASLLDDLGARDKTVRLAGDTAPQWVSQRLKKAGATVQFAEDPCALLRAAKNPVELAGSRAAHLRDGVAEVRFLAWLSEAAPLGKVTEISAAAKLDSLRASGDNFKGYSFPTISAAGPNGAMCHYRVSVESNRPLDMNSLYLVDSGGQYLDGTTDITRTVAIGTPSAEMKTRFTQVLKGHITLSTVRFPKGTTGSQLDVLARYPLWQAGVDFDHGTGHGVGSYLSVHEGPARISKVGNRYALLPGMILSNEPGYYKDDHFGIRIENLVAVRECLVPPVDAERPMLEFEVLTLAPIDRHLIEVSLLTTEEINWVNDYHSRVLTELSPFLEGFELDWLTQACAAL